MTPEEQKQKLEDVGKELIGVFNTEDQKDIIQLLDYVLYKYESYDWEEVGEFYENRIDYVKAAVENVRALSQGCYAASVSTPMYRFPDFTGIFEANDNTESWEYEGKSDNIVLRFKNEEGVVCEVILSTEGVEYTFEYVEEGDTYFFVEVPTKMSFVLREGDIEHISYTTELDIDRSSYVKQETSIRFANLSVVTEGEVTKNNVKANVVVKCGDKIIIQAEGEVPACNLKGKTDRQEWWEWFEDYGESLYDESGEISYGKIMGSVNIMGQIQLKAAISNIEEFCREEENLWEKYDYDYDQCYHERYYNTYEYNKKLADLYNNYLTCIVYYSSKVEQARLQFEPYIWRDYCYDCENRENLYDIMSVIYFPKDGTSYSFSDYFTEDAFRDLIRLTENMINDYIYMFDYIDMEPIDFD